MNIFIDSNVMKYKIIKGCIINKDKYNKEKNKLKDFRELLEIP